MNTGLKDRVEGLYSEAGAKLNEFLIINAQKCKLNVEVMISREQKIDLCSVKYLLK